MQDITHMPLKERFSHLYDLISGERFLKKQGLGNEVPFFICPYAPQEALEVDKHGRSLIKKLETANVSALKINLYDLSIELLKKRGIWEQILEAESTYVERHVKVTHL